MFQLVTEVRHREQDVDTKRSRADTVGTADKPNVRAVRITIEKGTNILLKCFLEPFCRYKYIYIYIYPKICFIQINVSQLKMGSKL